MVGIILQAATGATMPRGREHGPIMDVRRAIEERRALRSLSGEPLPEGLAGILAESASLAPSCFNKQPWRFVFASREDVLEQVFASLSRGNEWFRAASMVVGVASRRDMDCVLGEREYYLLDTGMALGMMLLRATELGLVAHPIAGFDEAAAGRALSVPPDYRLITLVAVGGKAEQPSPLLSDRQLEAERERPARLPLEEFAFTDSFGGEAPA